jgi:hypothetical protein
MRLTADLVALPHRADVAIVPNDAWPRASRRAVESAFSSPLRGRPTPFLFFLRQQRAGPGCREPSPLHHPERLAARGPTCMHSSHPWNLVCPCRPCPACKALALHYGRNVARTSGGKDSRVAYAFKRTETLFLWPRFLSRTFHRRNTNRLTRSVNRAWVFLRCCYEDREVGWLRNPCIAYEPKGSVFVVCSYIARRE